VVEVVKEVIKEVPGPERVVEKRVEVPQAKVQPLPPGHKVYTVAAYTALAVPSAVEPWSASVKTVLGPHEVASVDEELRYRGVEQSLCVEEVCAR
jgi:hypothetical protein